VRSVLDRLIERLLRSSLVRPRLASAFIAALVLAPSAAARAHPEAYGATLEYIRAATSSCPGQLPARGGRCTSLEPFAVTMRAVGTHSYRIDIANTRLSDNFRYFAWILPDGMTLQRIVSSRDGDCGISSGMISCTRKLVARGCACSQPDLVVDFTAEGRAPTRARGGYWIHYGLVTPFLDAPSTFNDVPICDNGEKSTRAHPCLE
jgi:hypothetical protein